MGHHLRWIALIGISLLAFTAFLDVTIVNTALPFIQKTFHTTILELQWVTNIFSMVLTVSMIAIGRCADLYGRKKVFYLGVTIFGIAAFCAGFSPTIHWLILFRGLQGLGAAVLFVASASLITDMFPAKERAKAIGLYSAITGLGLAIGPFVGGILVEWLSWRWVFWINVPFIAAGILACFTSLKLPQHLKTSTKIDWLGVLLLVISLSVLIYGIIETAKLSSTLPWVMIGVGVLFLCLFGLSEKKTVTPLIDFSIFKHHLIILSLFSCLVAGIVSFVFIFFDPLYLENVRHLSAFHIGLLILAIPVAQVIISFFFNPILNLFGIRKLMFISIMAAFVAIVLHGLIGTQTPFIFLVIPFALLGVNWGLSNAGTIAAVNHVVEPEKIAGAIGAIFMFWNMVGSIFLALSSAVFHKVDKTFLSGFHAVVFLNAIFAALVLMGAFFVMRKSKISSDP